MSNAVGRRIEKALEEYCRGDCESSLIHLFPAMDATAKKRYPDKKNKARMIQFAKDQLAIINSIGMGQPEPLPQPTFWDGADRGAPLPNPLDLPTIIYESARCSISHEGELDERILVTDDDYLFAFGHDHIRIDKSFILGMIVAVIVAPENRDQTSETPYVIPVLDTQNNLHQMWGEQDKLNEMLDHVFPGHR